MIIEWIILAKILVIVSKPNIEGSRTKPPRIQWNERGILNTAQMCLLLEVPETMDRSFSSWCPLCTVLLESPKKFGPHDPHGKVNWDGRGERAIAAIDRRHADDEVT